MGEAVEAEVGVEFAIEAGEYVFVEGCSDAGVVVVGRDEGIDELVLAGSEIDAQRM